MAKVLSCRDAGVDCDFVARADTVEGLMQKCAEHGKTAHGMTEISAELVAKMKGLIREE